MTTIAVVTGALAATSYTIATLYAILKLTGRKAVSKTVFLLLGLAGLAFHSINVYTLIITDHGVNLGFFPILSLLGWLVILIAIATSLFRSFENITVTAYPVATISVIITLLFHSDYQPALNLSLGMTAHILVSILADSVLFIAVGQAILIALQNRQLKTKHTKGLIQVLPPLQTMEAILFEIIWIGMGFLSLSIVTGLLFVENMIEQQVAHKTFFIVLAWLVFGILLWGRHRLGWRGRTAIRWTFAGFLLLSIGFLGSKFVVELLLQ